MDPKTVANNARRTVAGYGEADSAEAFDLQVATEICFGYGLNTLIETIATIKAALAYYDLPEDQLDNLLAELRVSPLRKEGY